MPERTRAEHQASQSLLLENLQVLRGRLLRRDTLTLVAFMGWALPAIGLLPTALMITFTPVRPVALVLLGYLPALAATAVFSWVRGLSLQSTARRIDDIMGLKERLATALELVGTRSSGRLVPVVLTEAVADSQRALTHRFVRPRMTGALAGAVVSLILLAGLGLLPTRWLPELLHSRQQEQTMQTASDILADSAARLHSGTPDLPGLKTTQIRLEIENLAERLARGTLTPEQTRGEIDNLRGQLDQLNPAGRKKAVERDLRNLGNADVLRKVLGAVRRDDAAGTHREAENVKAQRRNGLLTDGEMTQLRNALVRTASTTDRPGLAEAVGELTDALDRTDNAQFDAALDRLLAQLAAAVQEIPRQKQLGETVDATLRKVAALLAGKPTGLSAPARTGAELLPGDTPETETMPSGHEPGSSTYQPDDTTLSRRTLRDGHILKSSSEATPLPPGYAKYLGRYFQSEEN